MHHLLQKLLDKRGVDVKNLDEQEKQSFDHWNSALGDGELTLDKLEEYIRNQISFIETRWQHVDNKKTTNERLLMQHIVFSKILRLMTGDDPDRKEAEMEIQKLLDSTEE